jgi:hypothetical protein
MLDFDHLFDLPEEEDPEEDYPDYYYDWDKAVSEQQKPGFFDSDELVDIIEIYVTNRDMDKVYYAIDYATNLYSDDEDLLYDILLIFDDNELWNDLLNYSEKWMEKAGIWAEGHKLTALLHLGLEEESFQFFRHLKRKYAKDKESLKTIYQAMAESLLDVDLYDAVIKVVDESNKKTGENPELDELVMQSYVISNNKEKVCEIADKILKEKPLDGDLWLDMGNAFNDTEIYDRAIEAYENAHSLGRMTHQSMLNLIFAYQHSGSPAKALEKAMEFLKITPFRILFTLAAVKICSESKLWEEAINFLDEAINLEPDKCYLYYQKSRYLLELEEIKKAKQVLLEGIRKTADPEGELIKEFKRVESEFPDY